MNDAKLAPSILASDFANLTSEVERIRSGGAEWIHVDVMDGHFVPNLTIGAPVVKSLRKHTDLPLDVHLMIADPAKFVPDFIAAGSDVITFHVEAVDDPRPILESIRDAGRRGGLAVKPDTPASAVFPYLDVCDIVVIMTVEPGFGGQSFRGEMLGKIAPIIERARELGRTIDIEVDGGIDLTTIEAAREAGANVFVAGTAVFGADDVPARVRELRRLAGAG